MDTELVQKAPRSDALRRNEEKYLSKTCGAKLNSPPSSESLLPPARNTARLA